MLHCIILYLIPYYFKCSYNKLLGSVFGFLIRKYVCKSCSFFANFDGGKIISSDSLLAPVKGIFYYNYSTTEKSSPLNHSHWKTDHKPIIIIPSVIT